MRAGERLKHSARNSTRASRHSTAQRGASSGAEALEKRLSFCSAPAVQGSLCRTSHYESAEMYVRSQRVCCVHRRGVSGWSGIKAHGKATKSLLGFTLHARGRASIPSTLEHSAAAVEHPPPPTRPPLLPRRSEENESRRSLHAANPSRNPRGPARAGADGGSRCHPQRMGMQEASDERRARCACQADPLSLSLLSRPPIRTQSLLLLSLLFFSAHTAPYLSSPFSPRRRISAMHSMIVCMLMLVCIGLVAGSSVGVGGGVDAQAPAVQAAVQAQVQVDAPAVGVTSRPSTPLRPMTPDPTGHGPSGTLSHPNVLHFPLTRGAAPRKTNQRMRQGHPGYTRLAEVAAHAAQIQRHEHEQEVMAARAAGAGAGHAMSTMASTAIGVSPLFGCPFADFTGPFKIGSSVFELLVDTGSSTLALAGSSCTTCTGVSPLWQAQTGVSVDTGHSAQGSYGDNTGWIATVWTDTVTMSNVAGTVAEAPATRMNLAVMTAQSTANTNANGSPNADASAFFVKDGCFDNAGGTYKTAIVSQGIIGMAFANLAATYTDSFPVNLFAQHPSIPKQFAISMCEGSGNLWVGGVDTSFYAANTNILYTPIYGDLYWTVAPSDVFINGQSLGFNRNYFAAGSINIVDSGTTMWELPTDVYNAVVQSVMSHSTMVDLFPNFFDPSIRTCQTSRVARTVAQLQATLPTISVQFSNGLSITMDGVGRSEHTQHAQKQQQQQQQQRQQRQRREESEGRKGIASQCTTRYRVSDFACAFSVVLCLVATCSPVPRNTRVSLRESLPPTACFWEGGRS